MRPLGRGSIRNDGRREVQRLDNVGSRAQLTDQRGGAAGCPVEFGIDQGLQLGIFGGIRLASRVQRRSTLRYQFGKAVLLCGGEKLVGAHVLHDDQCIRLCLVQLLGERVERGARRAPDCFVTPRSGPK